MFLAISSPVGKNGIEQGLNALFAVFFTGIGWQESITNVLPAIGITELVI